MRKALFLCAVLTVIVLGSRTSRAQNLLTNGNLDRTHAEEIVPGFFLPKPTGWVNQGFRTISGPYEDEMSSEPWAGPAPTPVTTDGNLNPPSPDGCGGPDCAVFFKAFSGGGANGPATGHLFQDNPATPGLRYVMKGWAGAEANFDGEAEFALEFLGGGGGTLTSSSLNLITAGLFTPNGQPFNYKEYTISSIAPAGSTTVRVRASFMNGISNPAGGGQAYVVDDFSLTVPEPASAALAVLGLSALAARRRSSTR